MIIENSSSIRIGLKNESQVQHVRFVITMMIAIMDHLKTGNLCVFDKFGQSQILNTEYFSVLLVVNIPVAGNAKIYFHKI